MVRIPLIYDSRVSMISAPPLPRQSAQDGTVFWTMSLKPKPSRLRSPHFDSDGQAIGRGEIAELLPPFNNHRA